MSFSFWNDRIQAIRLKNETKYPLVGMHLSQIDDNFVPEIKRSRS